MAGAGAKSSIKIRGPMAGARNHRYSSANHQPPYARTNQSLHRPGYRSTQQASHQATSSKPAIRPASKPANNPSSQPDALIKTVSTAARRYISSIMRRYSRIMSYSSFMRYSSTRVLIQHGDDTLQLNNKPFSVPFSYRYDCSSSKFITCRQN